MRKRIQVIPMTARVRKTVTERVGFLRGPSPSPFMRGLRRLVLHFIAQFS
jgi:hypothetical protein